MTPSITNQKPRKSKLNILISSIICLTPLPLAQDMMTSTAMYGTACGLREQVPFSANEMDERLVDHKG